MYKGKPRSPNAGPLTPVLRPRLFHIRGLPAASSGLTCRTAPPEHADAASPPGVRKRDYGTKHLARFPLMQIRVVQLRTRPPPASLRSRVWSSLQHTSEPALLKERVSATL